MQDRRHFRVLIQSVSGLALIQVVGFAIRFVTGVLLTRLLGASQFGLYALVFAYVELLAVAATLGLDTVSARFIPGYGTRGETGRILAISRFAILTAGLASVTVALAAMTVLYFVFEPAAAVRNPLLLAIGLTMLPLVLLRVRQGVMQGLSRPALGQLSLGLVRPVTMMLTLSVFLLVSNQGFDIQRAIVLGFTAVAVAWVVSESLYRKSIREIAKTRPQYETRVWLPSMVALLGVAVVTYLNGQIDILLLGYLSDTVTVGIFNVANRIALLVSFLNVVTTSAFAPQIGEMLASRGTPDPTLGYSSSPLQKSVSSVVTITALGGVGMFLLVWLLGRPLLSVFGEEFTAGVTALRILAFAQLVNVLCGFVGMLLTMAGHEREVLRAVVISTVLNLILDLAWIPAYGLEGAATASALSLIAWNALLWVRTRQLVGVAPSVFRV